MKDNTTLNNFWIERFYERRSEIGEGWIDFEQEILNVLNMIEFYDNHINTIFIELLEFYEINVAHSHKEFLDKLKKASLTTNSHSYVLMILNKEDSIKWSNIYFKHIDKLIDNLSKDLDNLILAFEIYLRDVVEEISKKNTEKIYDINDIKEEINKVISFNYTSTFEILYDEHYEDKPIFKMSNHKYNHKEKVFYIHGKIRDKSEQRFNNMVLGINENLSDESKNINLKFIRFKKYFQRISKQTGAKYKEWVNTREISNYNNAIEGIDYYKSDDFNIKYNTFYFFGHSLDASDKDILSEIICSKNNKIKIFYTNKTQMDQQIVNLIKIIGQDNLIEYTYSENKKIEFLEQTYTPNHEELKKLNLFETYKYILRLKQSINSNNFDNTKSHLLDQIPERIFKKITYDIIIDNIVGENENISEDEINLRCSKEVKKYSDMRESMESIISKIKSSLNDYTKLYEDEQKTNQLELSKNSDELLKSIDKILEDKIFL